MSCQCKNGNAASGSNTQTVCVGIPNGGGSGASNTGCGGNIQGQTNYYSNTYDVNGASYNVNNQNYYKNYYNKYNHYYVTDTNYITDYVTEYDVYHVMQPKNYTQCYTVGTYTVVENGCMPNGGYPQNNGCQPQPKCPCHANVADTQKKYMCR